MGRLVGLDGRADGAGRDTEDGDAGCLEGRVRVRTDCTRQNGLALSAGNELGGLDASAAWRVDGRIRHSVEIQCLCVNENKNRRPAKVRADLSIQVVPCGAHSNLPYISHLSKS